MIVKLSSFKKAGLSVPLVLCTLLVSELLLAQTNTETVVVYGNHEERLLNQSSSLISLLDEDSLTQVNIEHPSQVIQNASGAWVSRGNGQEHLTAIRSPVFTGAGACGAFWMAEDGIALFADGFCNVNQLFSAHYEAARQVEVLKGPHATSLGSNALYGAINWQLSEADADENLLSLGASDEGFKKIHGRFYGGSGEHHLAAFVTLKDDEGFRDESGYGQQKLSLKHFWQRGWLTAESGMTLVHLEQETAGYINGLNAYKDSKLIRSNPNPEAYRDADSLRLYSRWRKRVVDYEWSFTPYFRSNKMNFLMHFVPWQPEEQNEHHSLGWQLSLRKYFEGGSQLVWGFESEKTRGTLSEVQFNEAPFNRPAFPVGTHYDYRVNSKNSAMYLGGYLQLSSRLFVDLGVRQDLDRYFYKTQVAPGSACEPNVNCRFYRPENRKNRFEESSAHLGFTWQFQRRLWGFGRWATGFRLPQASELYRAQSPEQSEVAPERLQSIELGIRGESGQHWFWQGALYWMESEDGVFQDTQRRYVNGVESSHRGLEYELAWRSQPLTLSWVGQLALHRYSNNPSVLGASESLKGKRMDTAPLNMQRLNIDWRFAEKWQARFSYSMMGKYYMDPANQFEYQGHELLDVALDWEPSGQLSWQLGLQNALDERYAERADVSFGEPRYFPGHSRTVFVGLKQSW